MNYKLHSQRFRENQYELFFDILDDDNNIIFCNASKLIGKSKLSDEEINTLFDESIFPVIEEQLSNQKENPIDVDILQELKDWEELHKPEDIEELKELKVWEESKDISEIDELKTLKVIDESQTVK